MLFGGFFISRVNRSWSTKQGSKGPESQKVLKPHTCLGQGSFIGILYDETRASHRSLCKDPRNLHTDARVFELLLIRLLTLATGIIRRGQIDSFDRWSL